MADITPNSPVAIIDKTHGFLNTGNIIENYRVNRAIYSQVPNPAGSGAGASVTITVDFGGLTVKTPYSVFITPDQACFCHVTARTATGFSVILTPTASGNTLAAGLIDIDVTFLA